MKFSIFTTNKNLRFRKKQDQRSEVCIMKKISFYIIRVLTRDKIIIIAEANPITIAARKSESLSFNFVKLI